MRKNPGRQDQHGRGPLGSVAIGAGVLGTAFLGSAVAFTGAARLLARVPLLTQSSLRSRPDQMIRAVHPDRIHLDVTVEAERGGVLALRQRAGAVHLRLGEVIGRPTATTVSRTLLAVDTEEQPEVGPASSNGYFWPGDPRTAHGLRAEDVQIDGPVGPMPAWLVPADPEVIAQQGTDGIWAILVHGHGATRGETLRVLPLLRRLGLASLAVTYRNDAGATPSADRMHHLGADEWEDAEAAISHALDHGARGVVLIGWSMGGGIALRTSVLSEHRDRILALVLDSPAIDWRDILTYHASVLRAPAPVRRSALWMMSSAIGARLVRLHEPIALPEMRAEFYAQHLVHRTLLTHALNDRTVPPGPSRLLAEARGDLVLFDGYAGATHTREWNLDAERWERAVARFLTRTLALPLDPEQLELPVIPPDAPPRDGATGLRL